MLIKNHLKYVILMAIVIYVLMKHGVYHEIILYRSLYTLCSIQ